MRSLLMAPTTEAALNYRVVQVIQKSERCAQITSITRPSSRLCLLPKRYVSVRTGSCDSFLARLMDSGLTNRSQVARRSSELVSTRRSRPPTVAAYAETENKEASAIVEGEKSVGFKVE